MCWNICLLRQRHFPVGIRGVALLFGDEILCSQSVVALRIQTCADFVSGCAVEVRLRGVDIFLAVAVLSLIVFGFGLGGGGAGFGNFLGTVAPLGLFRRGAGLRERCRKFLLVKRNQHLPGFDGVTLADEDFINAPANLRADANIPRFDGARAAERSVAMEHAGGVYGQSDESGDDENGNEDFAIHKFDLQRKLRDR